METDILLDMREDSFEGIAGVGNIEFRMAKVDEEVWKISFHTIVGTPKSPVRVVPSSRDFISCAFLEKRAPLVMPEFQPQSELCFADVR